MSPKIGREPRGFERLRIESKLSSYIVEELLDDEVCDGRDPLTTESVDSIGLEQLASFIELEFGVTISGEEMIAKNFAAVPVLAAFVLAKRRKTGV